MCICVCARTASLFPGGYFSGCRSQRDTAGEREERQRQLEECQKKLAMLEGDIATADNDRKQFDGEVKRRQAQRDDIR